MNKTKIWFGILVLFFFAAVSISPLLGSSYLNGFKLNIGKGSITGLISYDLSEGNESFLSDEVLSSKSNVSYCEIVAPEPTIILRMDDVTSYAPETMFLVEEIIKRNKSIALGLLPSSTVKEGIITEYLDSIKLLNNVEFVQHGVKHEVSESNVSEGDILWGKQRIYSVFSLIPSTYAPPYNELNSEAKKVIEAHFKILSNTAGVIKEGKLAEIGFNAEVYYYDKEEYANMSAIIKNCREGIEKTNVCVVLLHPQEYRGGQEKLVAFSNLLDELEKLGARFATFKDIVRCK